MQPWKDCSEFREFLAEQSVFPTSQSSSMPSVKNRQPQEKTFYDLQQAYLQLHHLEAYFDEKEKIFREAIKKLMEFLLDVRKISSKYTPAQLFEMLDPLRTWLFWQPVMFLQQTRGSTLALVTAAHYYTVALVVEPLFPEVGAAYFGSLTLKPIEEIACKLISSTSYQKLGDPTGSVLDMMNYPLEMAASFKDRMGWTHSKKSQSPLNYQRSSANSFKGYPAALPFLLPSNSKEQGQSTPADILPPTPSSLEPLSSPYFAMSPYMHEVYYSPGSSTFGGDLGFYSNDSGTEFPLFEGGEYSSCENYGNFTFPATTVWN